MILHPSPVSTDRFTYMPAERLLVAEASDLPAFERVFDDACDVGLTLISHRTGHHVVFAVNHIERDREGDTLYWDLHPAANLGDHSCTVRVFND